MICTHSSVSRLAGLMHTLEHDRRAFLQVDCLSQSFNVARRGMQGPASGALSRPMSHMIKRLARRCCHQVSGAAKLGKPKRSHCDAAATRAPDRRREATSRAGRFHEDRSDTPDNARRSRRSQTTARRRGAGSAVGRSMRFARTLAGLVPSAPATLPRGEGRRRP